jgi:annexin A7/11
MLLASSDRARSDAEWLRQPLARKFGVKSNLFIYRISTLYWDKSRLDAAKEAYKKYNNRPLSRDVKEFLSGDYEDLVLALIGEKKK